MTTTSSIIDGIVPGRGVRQVNENSWRIANPLELDPERAVVLHDLAQARVEVLNAMHFVQDAVHELIPAGRTQGFTFIYMPLCGRIEWRSGDRRWTVEPGQVIIAGGGEPQGAINLGERFEVVSVYAHIRLAAGLPDLPIFKEMVLPLPYPEFWHEKMNAVVSLNKSPAFKPVVEDLLRYLLFDLGLHGAELRPYKRTIDHRVEQGMETIREHMANPNVLRIACRAAKVCDSRLRVLFNRELGTSPKKYHRTLRLQEVMRLLGQHELSLKQIADRLGYANQQHLEKDFKRDYGMAPGKYRENM